jgi:hypothetical protein
MSCFRLIDRDIDSLLPPSVQDWLRVIAPHVTQAGNDKEQLAPMVAKTQVLPEGLNAPATLLADSGFLSQKNVECCRAAQIEPLMSVGCDAHHPPWRSRFEAPARLTGPARHAEQMKHALKTKAGRAAYALRKQTVEPVLARTPETRALVGRCESRPSGA